MQIFTLESKQSFGKFLNPGKGRFLFFPYMNILFFSSLSMNFFCSVCLIDGIKKITKMGNFKFLFFKMFWMCTCVGALFFHQIQWRMDMVMVCGDH